MNFLAHLLLSPHNSKMLLGNIVADFIPLKKIDCQEIQEGMQMHYFVDHFTDSHATVKHSNQLFKKDFHLISGVLVDIFYDHFLAIDFSTYSTIPLREFCEQIYDSVEKDIGQLPVPLPKTISKVIAVERLLSYQNLSGMEKALERINTRIRNPQFCICTKTAIANLSNYFEILQKDFQKFFIDLIAATNSYREGFPSFLKE